MFSIKWIFAWNKDKLFNIKYNKENSFNSTPVIAWLSLKIFFVESSDFVFLTKNLFLFWLVCGVNSAIFSKKNSRTYFLIKLSLIVLAIDLSFFSNIVHCLMEYSLEIQSKRALVLCSHYLTDKKWHYNKKPTFWRYYNGEKQITQN